MTIYHSTQCPTWLWMAAGWKNWFLSTHIFTLLYRPCSCCSLMSCGFDFSTEGVTLSQKLHQHFVPHGRLVCKHKKRLWVGVIIKCPDLIFCSVWNTSSFIRCCCLSFLSLFVSSRAIIIMQQMCSTFMNEVYFILHACVCFVVDIDHAFSAWDTNQLDQSFSATRFPSSSLR